MLPWDAFLRRYHPLARAIAERLNGRAAEADDIVQEAALSLLAAHRRDANRFASTEHARNYFLKTVRNLASRTRERQKPTKPLESEPLDETEAADSAESAAHEARRRELRRLLLTLPNEESDLVVRRFLKQQTLAEVSEATGVPVSTLHNREKGILERLRRAIDRLEREDRNE